MPCALRELIHREGRDAVPAGHLARCAECAATAARLELARATLAGQAVTADPHLATRTLAALRARRRRDPWLWPIRAACVGLGVVVAALLVLRLWPPAPAEPTARRRPALAKALPPGESLRLNGLTLTALRAGTFVAVTPGTLRLQAGAVRATVRGGGPSWTLHTPADRFELREAASAVLSTEAPPVIERGRVRVLTADGPKWLGRGADAPDPDASSGPARPAHRPPPDDRARPSTPREPRPPARDVPVAPRREAATRGDSAQRDRVGEADRLRRAGQRAEALRLYRKVADDPRAHPYDTEYALLQGATILAEQGRSTEALALLASAPMGWTRGALVPERARLAVDLRLSRGQARAAAALLEGLAGYLHAPPVIEARIRVARALASTEPARARRLLAPVDLSRADPDLVRSVRETKARMGRDR